MNTIRNGGGCRWSSLSRCGPVGDQQLYRRLWLEQLEDRRMLASLVGVDFDVVPDNAPTDWVSVSFFTSGQTFSNIGGTEIDITFDFDDIAEVRISPIDVKTIPSESFVDNLDKLDGFVSIGTGLAQPLGSFTATWSDLKSGFTYEVYVFGLFDDPFPSVEQGIDIGSGSFEFEQLMFGKNELWVNSRKGSSSEELVDFAVSLQPNFAGKIDVRIHPLPPNVERDISIGGLAIREVGIIVNSTGADDDGDANNGVMTLREATNLANTTPGAEFIGFDETVFSNGQPITLGGVPLEIDGPVTIDASSLLGNVMIDAEQQSRHFNITADAGDVTLGALTLTAGLTTGDNIDENDTSNNGGAIKSESAGKVTLRDSLISGNGTVGKDANGGGAFIAGAFEVINSIFLGNHTGGDYAYGGALAVGGGLTVTGSTIEDNFTTGATAIGGGIHANSNATFTDTTIRNNYTSGDFSPGGGVSNGGLFSQGAMTFNRSTVSGNWTMEQFSPGGGIDAHGDVTIIDSGITGNNTSGPGSNGGGIHVFGGDITITGSTVSGNSAAGDQAGGGGVSANDLVTASNSSFSGNSVNGANADGGAILSGGDVTLTQSTVTGNQATGAASRAGGLIAFTGNVMLNGSIVAANTAVAAGPDFISILGGTLTANYSLIGVADGLTIAGNLGNQTGTAANPLDPLLGPLANKGGLTLTHAPILGSPVIDMGDPAIATSGEHDQRGFVFSRVVNGRIDIGAFESGAASADFDGDGIVGGGDFLRWQRGVGTSSAVLHADGDADVNGVINDADYDIWQQQFAMTHAAMPLLTHNAVLEFVEEAHLADPLASAETTREQSLSAEFVDLALAMASKEQSMFGSDDPIAVEAKHDPIGRVTVLTDLLSIGPRTRGSQDAANSARSSTTDDAHKSDRFDLMDGALQELLDLVFE